MLFESLMRLLNALITLSFFPLLYRLYKRTRRRFFLFWSLGFLLYGLNILLRVVANEIIVNQFMLFVFFLTTMGFILIVTGIGELVNETRNLLATTLILPIILVSHYLIGGAWQHFIWLIVLSPYLFIVISLIIIMRYFQYDLKLLLAGWTNILILNMAFAFNMMNPGFVDLLSAVAKIMIYWGMTTPRFAFIVDDLNQFMVSGLPTEYHLPREGTLTLVNLQENTREKEITWIQNRIASNNRKGVRTVFISHYDLITSRDLNMKETGDTFFMQIKTGVQNLPDPFTEKATTIGDDISQLNFLFTDIINSSNEYQVESEVIIYSLSTIIHTKGWKRVYTFLINMMPKIRSGLVHLTCFYYPETHETSADITKFEIMADTIITQN